MGLLKKEKIVINDYSVMKSSESEFFFVISKENNLDFLKTCVKVFYKIKKGKLALYYKGGKNHKIMVFKNLPESVISNLSFQNKILIIEKDKENEENNFNYIIEEESQDF
jgi:hypothetical protein